MDKQYIIDTYLIGEGIEIGALQNPLRVGPEARVKYVDKLSLEDLKSQHPWLGDEPITAPDIIADGETLEGVPDESQDFVIASHFLEHAQNPLLAIQNMLRVLKTDKYLYLAVPDKKNTFDITREITKLDHVEDDYSVSPEPGRADHYRDHVAGNEAVNYDLRLSGTPEELMEKGHSIHFHVWTQFEIAEMLIHVRRKHRFPFEIEVLGQGNAEVLVVLRKTEVYDTLEKLLAFRRRLKSVGSSVPAMYDAQVDLGMAFLNLPNIHAAEEAFRAAIAMDPNKLKANLAMCRVRIEQRRFDQAEEFLKKVQASDPDYAEAQELLAEVAKRREWEKPHVIRILLDRARLHLGQAKKDVAVVLTKRALDYDPENKDAAALLKELEA